MPTDLFTQMRALILSDRMLSRRLVISIRRTAEQIYCFGLTLRRMKL
jgi:hypothetical protein